MRKRLTGPIIAILLTCAAVAEAEADSPEDRFSVGLSTGILGTGVDASYAITDRFSIRANGNYGRYEFPEIFSLASSIAGIPYDYDLRLLTAGLLVDYQVWTSRRRPGNSITITGGAYYNANRFDLTSTPFSNLTIGGTSYTPAQIGTLNADLDFDRDFAPYVGIGAETNFFLDIPVSVFARAGVLFQGPANARLSSSGGGVSASDIAAEEADLEDSLGFVEVLPVFWIGGTVRF